MELTKMTLKLQEFYALHLAMLGVSRDKLSLYSKQLVQIELKDTDDEDMLCIVSVESLVSSHRYSFYTDGRVSCSSVDGTIDLKGKECRTAYSIICELLTIVTEEMQLVDVTGIIFNKPSQLVRVEKVKGIIKGRVTPKGVVFLDT